MNFMLFYVVATLAIPAASMAVNLPTTQKTINSLCERLPVVTLKDYKLSIDKPLPHSVDIFENATEKNRVSIVFDGAENNKNISELEQKMKAEKIAVLVTEDFIATPKNGALEIYNFRTMKNLPSKQLDITHSDWIDLGKKLLLWGVPLFSVFMFISIGVGIFIITVFHACVAALIARFFTYRPNFPALMRLSAAAIIPVALLGLLLPLAKVQINLIETQMIWLAFAIYGLVGVNETTDKPQNNA